MPGVMLFEFDDILTNTSYKVFSDIRKHWRIFNRWFVDSGPLTMSDVDSRKVFAMNEWLMKKEAIQMNSKEYLSLQLMIMSEMNKTVFSDYHFYDDMAPSKFAESTLMNKMYVDNDNIKDIFIISRNHTDAQDTSKRNFVKRYFNHPKIHYLPVKFDERKSHIIKSNGIPWNMCIENELIDIRDLAENFDLDRKEFLIPHYGYNHIDPYLKTLIEGKGGILNYLEIMK